ncbi:putative RING finger protein, partial [Neolecta irregularis DAH-3]
QFDGYTAACLHEPSRTFDSFLNKSFITPQTHPHILSFSTMSQAESIPYQPYVSIVLHATGPFPVHDPPEQGEASPRNDITPPHVFIFPSFGPTMLNGSFQFISANGLPKRHATDAAVSKLVPVDLATLPEDERKCSICMERFCAEPCKLNYGDPFNLNPAVPTATIIDKTPIDPSTSGKIDDDDEPANIDISAHEARTDGVVDAGPEKPLQLPCGHVFGNHCLTHWLKESPACPLCRFEIPSVEEPMSSQVLQGVFWFPLPFVLVTRRSSPTGEAPSQDRSDVQSLLAETTSSVPRRVERHHPYARQDLECAQRTIGLCNEEHSPEVNLECGHRFHPLCLTEAFIVRDVEGLSEFCIELSTSRIGQPGNLDRGVLIQDIMAVNTRFSETELFFKEGAILVSSHYLPKTGISNLTNIPLSVCNLVHSSIINPLARHRLQKSYSQLCSTGDLRVSCDLLEQARNVHNFVNSASLHLSKRQSPSLVPPGHHLHKSQLKDPPLVPLSDLKRLKTNRRHKKSVSSVSSIVIPPRTVSIPSPTTTNPAPVQKPIPIPEPEEEITETAEIPSMPVPALSNPLTPYLEAQKEKMTQESIQVIINRNAGTIQTLKYGSLASNAAFITFRGIFNYTTISKSVILAYLITSFISLLFQLQIYWMTRPVYDGKKVLNLHLPDLNGDGLTVAAYMLDVCYISWAIHVLAIISDRAWVLFGVIPLYFAYFATSRQPILQAAASSAAYPIGLRSAPEPQPPPLEIVIAMPEPEVPPAITQDLPGPPDGPSPGGFPSTEMYPSTCGHEHHAHRFFCNDGAKLSKRYSKHLPQRT